MKKIFSCHTSFSWEGIKDSERHRWICSMMDIIRTFDILPHNILSSSLGPYTKWNACEQIYVKCNKIRKRTDITQLASWAIKICNSICYPPHMDSINVKPIFRQLDFIGAVKDYLMMIAIYENSFIYKTNCFELLKNSKKESIDKMRRLFNEQRKEPSKKIHTLEDYICNNILGTDSTKISSYNSIYDFLILKGLLTTPAKNNPYILLYEHLSSDDDERNKTEASKSLMNSKRKDLRIHDLEELLDHFSLHIIKIEDQSTSFQCLANYIIERITNINLVNHIYDSFKKFEKPKENLKIWYYLMNLFGVLGIYPLVKFRLRLIEWYINNCKETDNKLDKNTLKDIGYTIFYQTFVFFPMLQNVFTLLLSPGRNTFSKETEDDNDKDALFQENFPKDKKRVGFTIRPVHDFPDLLDKDDKIMYNDILKMVLRAYYESLTLPNNFSIRGDNIRGEETIINYHVARSRNNLTIGAGDDFLRTKFSYLDQYIIDELKYHSLLENFLTWSYSPRID